MEKEKKSKSKEVFEKKPKETKKIKPKPKIGEEEEGIFEATEGKIKEGGLRKALGVEKDYKFTKSVLNKLLKNEVGKKFDFQGKKYMMSERLKKQLQLALNMMK
tara:strand:- start:418 stop:729 length:312 start_codon:yes stop_codon:yes gene_type:complete